MSAGPVWSQAEIIEAISMKREGKSWDDIPSRTGRPRNACKEKLLPLMRADDSNEPPIRMVRDFVADGLRVLGGARA